MFLSQKVEVGRVRQGATAVVNFPYDGIQRIVSMTPNCGCGQVYHSEAEKKVWVSYTAGSIEHIQEKSVNTEKTVTVVYINAAGLEQTEVLTFTATVFKKF